MDKTSKQIICRRIVHLVIEIRDMSQHLQAAGLVEKAVCLAEVAVSCQAWADEIAREN